MPLLKRKESGIQPDPSPPVVKQEEKDPFEIGDASSQMPAPPPTPTRKRRRKHKRPNQGDSPHLQKWREFYKKWHGKHGEHETIKGMKTIDKAKAAGVAYRHHTGKKRASDPEKPEFPFDQ
jgi:hypothetical protein